MIQIKNAKELTAMRRACEISAEALRLGGGAIEAGITTAEIDKIIRDEAKQALAAGKGVAKEEAPTDEERANADVDEDPDLALLDEE